MKRVLAVMVLFVATVSGMSPAIAQDTSPCLPTGPIASEAARTGGWIGGTLESFEALYGESTSTSALFNEFQIDGCKVVIVDEQEGFVTSIMLFPPRESDDKSYLDADEADWELAYALWISQAFLPPDSVILKDMEVDIDNLIHQNGYSQILMDTVPPAIYEYVMNPPVAYGGFQVIFRRPLDGPNISSITIQLATEVIAT